MANRAASPAEVGTAYFELYHQLHRTLDQALCEIGLSFARSKVLMRLREGGPMNQATLAGLLGYAPRSVTDTVDALERDGLVTRTEDERDRRARIVTLTDKGRDAVRQVAVVRRKCMEKTFGKLSASERDHLIALLATVRTNAPSGDPCVQ